MNKKGTERDASLHELERVAREVARRGRMAVTLGESLGGLIREGVGAGSVDLLYALAGQLARNGPLGIEQDEVDQPRANKDKSAQGLKPLRLLHQSSVQDERVVAAFLGCRQVDGQWLTLGMGIDLTGNRCVIGLWKGSTSQSPATKQMVSDLTSRAIDTSRGLLVVTDGGKAIEQAILARFGQDVLLARCPLCWQQRVSARLPDTMHQEVKTTMQTVVQGEKGQDSVRRLIEKLRGKRQIEPTLTLGHVLALRQ